MTYFAVLITTLACDGHTYIYTPSPFRRLSAKEGVHPHDPLHDYARDLVRVHEGSPEAKSLNM